MREEIIPAQPLSRARELKLCLLFNKEAAVAIPKAPVKKIIVTVTILSTFPKQRLHLSRLVSIPF